MSQVMNSRADRALSFDLEAFPIPHGREEDWRFTPIEKIDDFFTGATDETPAVTVTGDARYELIARDDSRLGRVSPPEDRTSVVEWNAFTQAHAITLPRDTKLEHETVIAVTGQGNTDVAPLHVYVEAESHSEGIVVLTHNGTGRINEGVEIVVGDGAHLTFVTVQEWDEGTVHTASNRIRIGRDATLKHIVVSLGGSLVRVVSSVEYSAPGANVNMLGAYFVDGGQHIENRLLVDHSVPNAISNVTYKGALQGTDAHSVWVGDVLIRPEGTGTNTYELNRNLLLTRGARADSVPNLEIETGEIEGAGHASATGRFDDEQLFYLMSRGISEDEARRLVVRGFFAELIQQIGVEQVEAKLMQAIEAELDLTMGCADNA
ncbi:Fe-S cluster assembly protein SufD [Arcanobacterium haemolyticum]|uniref:FeS assembly protein SufD n=1 Tax=Arcanobacterium haemolyticum (strain ATCC 9345 / DSM 20595 / CCM 5947 / CCUG 17215 / LMG 16163 / NBRC 15585 / NCTC 8452 / 11018) TaxID=644284 RepID=D7BP09_ARCHD|nr:Fe-S cluster assembly protein SufD [Arcanobacterium haemolyticum]ADH92658.1 FeS assembly protein SufD [Arcanobacterium haemolyticum DSM 20595]QCX46769.1 Fe-S cluster assembly protein SufD [Arcanobacterium haemolyticum]SQH28605.1 cysteine desulfurase activator complex subunit SufD [Arcanobacterium haemolyticum]